MSLLKKNMLSKAEVIKDLGISATTFVRYVKAGRLKTVRIGRSVYVHRDVLDLFLRGMVYIGVGKETRLVPRRMYSPVVETSEDKAKNHPNYGTPTTTG